MNFTSRLRTAFFIVLIHSFIPLLILAAIQTHRERVLLERQINQTFDFIRASTRDRISSQISEARTLVQALSQASSIRTLDNTRCNQMLRRVIENNPYYTNLAVFNIAGYSVCSVLPSPTGDRINVADRQYFQDVIRTRQFTISTYTIGRFTGTPVIIAAYPINNDNDEIVGVMVAGIKMQWLDSALSQAATPDKTALMVVDHEANILAHYPDNENYLGKSLSNNEVYKQIHSTGEGTTEVRGVGEDGINRLYKHAHISAANNHLHLLIGFPTDFIQEQTDRVLLQNTIIVLITSLAILAIVLFDLRIISTVKKLSKGA